jgi:hypothetical protein
MGEHFMQSAPVSGSYKVISEEQGSTASHFKTLKGYAASGLAALAALGALGAGIDSANAAQLRTVPLDTPGLIQKIVKNSDGTSGTNYYLPLRQESRQYAMLPDQNPGSRIGAGENELGKSRALLMVEENLAENQVMIVDRVDQRLNYRSVVGASTNGPGSNWATRAEALYTEEAALAGGDTLGNYRVRMERDYCTIVFDKEQRVLGHESATNDLKALSWVKLDSPQAPGWLLSVDFTKIPNLQPISETGRI